MTTDPGRLASSLDAFGKNLSDSSMAIADTVKTASHDKVLGTEQVIRAEKQSNITANQLANDQDLVKRTEEALKTLDEHCRDGLTQAHQTFNNVQAALLLATSTLAHWEAELQKAQAWLARALERLDAARRALAQAQAELSHAQNVLYHAQNALSSCQNNKERSNCSGEASAVRNAQARVYAAQQEVAVAEQEVREAEAEVALARARVAACTKAVSFAKEAVKVAQITKITAQQGIDRAERSIEYVAATHKAVEEVKKALETEEAAVEAMKIAVRLARQSEVEATQHLKTAENYEEAIQRTADGAGREIRENVYQLHMYNREDLGELGTIFHNLLRPDQSYLVSQISMKALEMAPKAIPFLKATMIAATMVASVGRVTSAEIEAHIHSPGQAHIPSSIIKDIDKVTEAADQVFEDAHTVLDIIEEDIGE